MASPHPATLVDRASMGNYHAVRLRLSQPLLLTPGSCIIVDCGFTLRSGKAAKRAYSVIAIEHEGRDLCLAFESVNGGEVSTVFGDLPLNSAVTFSGPWGKFNGLADELTQPPLLVATDTGLSAVIGLAGQWKCPAQCIWLRQPDDAARWDFLCSWLCTVPSIELQSIDSPSALEVDRVTPCVATLQRAIAERKARRVAIAGDGLIVRALAQRIEPACNVVGETFFNYEQKKSN